MYFAQLPFSVVTLAAAVRSLGVVITANVRMGKRERKEEEYLLAEEGRKEWASGEAGKQAGWSGLRVKVEVPSRRGREPEGTDGRVDQPQLRGSRTQPLYFPHIWDLSGYWLGWRQSNALQRCVKSFLHV